MIEWWDSAKLCSYWRSLFTCGFPLPAFIPRDLDHRCMTRLLRLQSTGTPTMAGDIFRFTVYHPSEEKQWYLQFHSSQLAITRYSPSFKTVGLCCTVSNSLKTWLVNPWNPTFVICCPHTILLGAILLLLMSPKRNWLICATLWVALHDALN